MERLIFLSTIDIYVIQYLTDKVGQVVEMYTLIGLYIYFFKFIIYFKTKNNNYSMFIFER